MVYHAAVQLNYDDQYDGRKPQPQIKGYSHQVIFRGRMKVLFSG